MLPPCGHFYNLQLYSLWILPTFWWGANVLLLLYFLQIWTKYRNQSFHIAAPLPNLKRDREMEMSRKMKKKRGHQEGTGPNESAAKAAILPYCARCATFSSTPELRPRSTTEERRTRGSCGDWLRLSAQVEILPFYVFLNKGVIWYELLMHINVIQHWLNNTETPKLFVLTSTVNMSLNCVLLHL